MSIDHTFFNKEKNEVCYFQQNYFIEYSFSHIINNKWYTNREVIKLELEAIVAKYGDCISKLSEENVIPPEKELYDMKDDDILNNKHSARFFFELITHFNPVVLDYMYRDQSVRSAIVTMFYKFIDAYFQLKKLFETFDFENDKLTIVQTG